MRCLARVCLPILLLSGCIIHGGEDDPCERRKATAGNQAPVELVETRDPQTGLCSSVGGAGWDGGDNCDDYGGGLEDEARPQPAPDWAVCNGICEGLDESTCLGTPACRVAYEDLWGTQVFHECWGTAPTGPVQGGDCTTLDAYECSRHDDCSVVHSNMEAFPGDDGEGFTNLLGEFQSCIPEQGTQIGCYSDDTCAPGTHCTADTECLADPNCWGDSGSDGNGAEEPTDCSDSTCYGYCVPDDQPDPGTCYGDVNCFTGSPDCPTGTTPGIADGCWTGYCIPLNACEMVPANCSTLDETQCVTRSDCQGIYEGENCSCTPDSCVCADWNFVACEAGTDSLLPAP